MKSLLSLGIVKGFLAGIAGAAAGMGATMLIRLWMGLTAWESGPVASVGIITGVLAYLAALGLFSYWLRWATGTEEKEKEFMPEKGWRRYFNADTNHKIIGIQYLVTAMIFLPFAVALQLVGRLDLSKLIPAISTNAYESLISTHGLIMFFFVVIPAFTGLMNYLVPLLIGARDMAFPRLNAIAFWMVIPAALLVVFSLTAGGFDTGWTVYPPLSASFENVGMDMVLLGIYLGGLATILSSVNILATIIKMRAPGMNYFRLPIFVWSALATAVMTLTFTQFIAMSFLMVLFERLFGMGFFNPLLGGQVLLYQYMFWFYSHPAVYVFVLLGLGIISDIIPVFTRKPLFGYKAVAIASPGIAAGGMIVFGHHMFASGMPAALRIPFMATTLLVAVPTGVKVFAWTATMWRGKIQLSTPLLFVLSSIVIFLAGGLMGIPLGIVPIDLYLHDTYWVVGHFHAMVFGGFLLPTMAAIYYWFPKVSGKMLNEKWGKIQWVLMTLGTTLLFIPMLMLGIEGMRRRVVDYAAGMGIQQLHIVTAVGGFLVFAGLAVLVYNIVISIKRGVNAGNNPWGGSTLEWMVSSPPPENNFEVIPEVLDRPHLHGVEGSVHARFGTGDNDQNQDRPVEDN
jgi:cytochrome c oxidase subunit 1